MFKVEGLHVRCSCARCSPSNAFVHKQRLVHRSTDLCLLVLGLLVDKLAAVGTLDRQGDVTFDRVGEAAGRRVRALQHKFVADFQRTRVHEQRELDLHFFWITSSAAL